MGFFDHDLKLESGLDSSDTKEGEYSLPTFEVKLPNGTDFVPVNKNCVKRYYSDDLGGPLVIICDECAELFGMEAAKSEEAKEENALKGELIGIIKSITQLGRSAGIHMLLATQRPDAKIIPGQIQNNCLKTNTKIVTKNG